MTSAAIERLGLYLANPRWRLTHLYPVKPKTGPVIRFVPNRAQEILLSRWHRRNFILKARKMGFSTLIDLIGGDECIWVAGQEMAIVDRTLDDAKDKLAKIRLAYEEMGMYVPGLTYSQRRELNGFLHTLCPLKRASDTEMEWMNGSKIRARASYRGGNPTFVHVSELGAIALDAPTKAREIITGTMESVARGNTLIFESTHKGGPFGVNYDLMEQAMANEAKEVLDEMDLRFFFFPWYWEPDNILPGHGPARLEKEHADYFKNLAADPEFGRLNGGQALTEDQKRWWVSKKITLKHDMGREHPSVPSEAVEAPIEGAIYGTIVADIQAEGRIGGDWGIDRRYPVWCCWDIGHSDFTSIWAVQVEGREILWLDWYEAAGMEASHYAGVIREWSGRYPIAGHFLPHDAANEHFGVISARNVLSQAGITNIVVNPRCVSPWDGINELRRLLRRSRFHARTEGGLAHLKAYRKHLVESGSAIREEPVHDEHSHTADAARTFAEAFALGRVLEHFPRPRNGQVPERAILG